MSPFPWSHTCILATQLRFPPDVIHWSIGLVSHSVPVPGLATRTHWIYPAPSPTKHLWPLSLCISCFSTTAIYPMSEKHWEMYLHTLQKQLSLFIQLSPCVKTRNWIIHCMPQTLMTKLGFASLSSREEGEWKLREEKSNRKRPCCVPLLHCWEHCGCYN